MKIAVRRASFLATVLSVFIVAISYITWRSGAANKKSGRENALSNHRWRHLKHRLLDCFTHGAWEFQPGLTREMIRERRQVDKSILENLGFPRELHRDDKRCGQDYPLPSPKFKLASLCDEDSETPCCNELTGMCRKSKEDCTCSYCKDFSKYFAAELADWKPSSQECPFKRFRSDDACSLLNEHALEIAFVGDSFIRHFFVAFSLLVTGDPVTGALKRRLPDEEKQQCSGELQFVDRGKHSCHLKTIQNWEEFGENKVCNRTAHFKTYLVQAYSIAQRPLAVQAVKNLLGQRASVIVLGVGIHFSLNATNVYREYLTPLLDLIKNHGNGWPSLIWANIHRVDNYLVSDTQKNYSPVEKFNQEMSLFCSAEDIPVLETSRVTRFIKSNDGLHFGYGGNMAKVQILMNYFKSFFETYEDSEQN